MTSRERLVATVKRVQAMPYTWPMDPSAEATRAVGRGTCAGKHAVLREDLEAAGFTCARLMVVGPLAPPVWPDLAELAEGLLEVHECLTVETSWAGPLRLDVTWPPEAIRRGLPGSLDWDAHGDMICAVEPVSVYAVSHAHFRSQKERLRHRLYTGAQRQTRDDLLAEIARRAAM